uniref:KGK domain-containing protein n=1 Tax=Oscillatoriales cyanobacterium SpSt-402 TaxID=2282168 RepID=A0A832H3D2_9CYAN
MENQNHLNLGSDVVISTDASFLGDLKTSTVEQLSLRVRQILGTYAPLIDGTPCRVLEPGKTWRHGMVQIVIQFQPNDPET